LTELAATPAPELDPLSIPAETPVPSPVKVKKKPKEQKQIIDDITELADGPGAKINRGRNAGFGAPLTKDVSNILTETHFLPRSSVMMRLLEIREDPLAHFMPTTVTPSGTYFCAAPPGIGPDLAGLFMRPLHSASAKRRSDAQGSPSKKRRLKDAEDLDEIEQGRRAASIDPSVLGADAFARESVGPDFDFGDQSGMAMGDFEIPIPDFDTAGADLDGKSVALSRLSTPAPGVDLLGEGDESYADLTCPIAMFDERAQTQSQPQGTQTTEKEPEANDVEGKGYSKNTVKALGIIRKELQPDVGDEDEEKTIGFVQMSEKVSVIPSFALLS
jgi:cohesin complex subunit SCC1